MEQPRNVIGDRRPPSRGDQQRGLIVGATVELLNSAAIADLTVARIAKHAGVTRPAFYFYFETKYAALAAALEEVWIELDTATSELADYDFTEPPEVFSNRMIDNAVSVWQRHAALLRACMQARPSDPQLRDLWDRFVANLSGKLASFIDTLKGAGQARPASDDTPALTHALVGLTIWALVEEHSTVHPISQERLMATVRAIWVSTAWGMPS